ncbi:MAG: alanine--tRNA ligase [Saprospiraceae bacterium]|nr:alanine--tRNA ligase [Saprospiraceae bacterium]
MKAKQIRQTFLDFFQSKEHKIVPSAPIVTSNDPTLLFTNAGMNQFKDYFLGNQVPPVNRIADTQKCLRVSGKHNDLEEVGVDSYHHTMFEMLGNWSFGDYFKDDAIKWAWELLTDRLGLSPDRLYVTIFGGDPAENLKPDEEAADLWKRFIPVDRILRFGKKDNFWEMGDTGPCGPCSEIHIDLRDDAERSNHPATALVNNDHPQVIEIWNLVFIQYNRKQDSTLELLPAKHVDTGMGFERLCMALQGKKSNYDTDLFTPYLDFLQERTGIRYTSSYTREAKTDMAMRVIADHIRAVCFTIADGAMPSSGGAGYVVRRILRRAVRYYYSFLNIHEPLLYEMVPIVANSFSEIFPELIEQKDFVTKVIQEEEKSFLRTLEAGLRRLDALKVDDGTIDGQVAFELYDTYGFPIDLTRLIARERDWDVDEAGFEAALAEQRNRSKTDARKDVGDWYILKDTGSRFVGYDQLSVPETEIIKYRTVTTKSGPQKQAVLSITPFYAEGGGQVGDTGVLIQKDSEVKVLDTIKENDLFIHILDEWPKDLDLPLLARVDHSKRHLTENNHSATHLMHAALRRVLGDHVVQKGSLVNDRHLRFDFSHFTKMTSEEILQVEHIVNDKIRKNIQKEEARDIPITEAKEAGAMMLFGEKYGENVRMITFDPDYSVELCGGCHVKATGQIGYFKIISESAIAAGVRRIEAVTADSAEEYLDHELQELEAIRQCFKSPQNVADQVASLVEENKSLQKRIEQLQNTAVMDMKNTLKNKVSTVGDVNYLAEKIDADDSKAVKNLIFQLQKEINNAFIVLGMVTNDKPQIMVAISDSLVKDRGLHAGNIVRELAKLIEGGGGGQPFFASAGGKNASGLDQALSQAKDFVTSSN